jgi:hypothetical protein
MEEVNFVGGSAESLVESEKKNNLRCLWSKHFKSNNQGFDVFFVLKEVLNFQID